MYVENTILSILNEANIDTIKKTKFKFKLWIENIDKLW